MTPTRGQTVWMLAAILSAAASPPASAQARTVTIGLQVKDCKGLAVPGAIVYLNGQAFQTNANGASFGGPVAPGRVQVRAAAQGLVLSYVTFNPSGVSGSATSYGDAEGNVAFNTGPYSGELVLTMCPGKAAVHVQIITTSACTDAPNSAVAPQSGVTVRIGNNSYTSDARGVIETDLPAGDYDVGASWKDNPLGYVAQNGLRQPKGENGATRVRLSGASETLEVRMLTCDANGQPKARATVTEISGLEVYVVRSRARGKAFVGMQLRDGDTVYVKGTAKLKWLEDGGTIVFGNPNVYTVVTIGPDSKPAGTAAPPPPASGGVNIMQGVMELLLPPAAEEPQHFKFEASSRTIAVGIKGTHFIFAHDPTTQTSSVTVQEGSVAITPKNRALQPFVLAAGQRVSVTPQRIGQITGATAGGNVSQAARSQHGCSGFDGSWRGPLGVMRLRNGSGIYSSPSGNIAIRGNSLAGNTLSGTYAFSTGGGTFVFTLAPNGDSFGTMFTSSAGVRGVYTVMQCAGG